MPHMHMRNRDKTPDADVETQATCLDTGGAYVRCWGDITRMLRSTAVGLRAAKSCLL